MGRCVCSGAGTTQLRFPRGGHERRGGGPTADRLATRARALHSSPTRNWKRQAGRMVRTPGPDALGEGGAGHGEPHRIMRADSESRETVSPISDLGDLIPWPSSAQTGASDRAWGAACALARGAWGGLQFSSRHQTPRRGQGGPGGGGSKIFLHFGGIFGFPISFRAFWIYTNRVKFWFYHPQQMKNSTIFQQMYL